MNRWQGVLSFCAVWTVVIGAAVFARPATGELPEADRTALDTLLGPDVIGAARPGKPLPDWSAFMPAEGAIWIFRYASGEKRGDTERVVLTRMPNDDTEEPGRLDVGGRTIYYVRDAGDGDLLIESEHSRTEGRITRFVPSEPMILSGMQPGTSKQTKANIELSELSDPNEVEHRGTVDLTYSYLGVYEVTVPAGTFDAMLIKWHYDGEVGPADVEDTQYCFFAEGMGPLAMVDKSDISAYLIYQDYTKTGKVLMEKHR